jgi:hypothetical protein
MMKGEQQKIFHNHLLRAVKKKFNKADNAFLGTISVVASFIVFCISLTHRSALVAVKSFFGNKRIILGTGDKVIKFSASTTNSDSFTRSNKNTTIQFSSYSEVEGWERKVFRVEDNIKKIISTVLRDVLVYKVSEIGRLHKVLEELLS